MNSMTGYGKSVAESDGRKITVEMKSVNHRFLDVTVKLPKVLSFAEDAVRRVIIDNFKRGHFDVYVTYENTKNDGVELSVNEEVAKEYLKIKDVLCDKYGVQDDFTVTALMRTADVIETKTVEEDEDALKFLIESATSGASEQMKKMRAFEGEKLIGYVEGSIEGWNNRFRLSNICVLDFSERSRGVGTALMKPIERAAEDAGARMLILETQSCNENAIAFYKKNGFTIVGFDLYAYSNDDPERHEVRIEMGKKLH